MSHFAAALARTDDGWTGRELDLNAIEDLEALTDQLRDLSGEDGGPSLLLLEEDDEYVAVVRVDGGASGLDDPRIFLSDRRAGSGSGVAAMLWDQDELGGTDDDEDDEDTRPVVEPVGDAALLSDLGVTAHALLDLCAEEGLMPADVLSGVADRVGFLEILEGLREA